MVARPAFAILLLCALLSGCLVQGDLPEVQPIVSGSPPDGEGAGTASTHARPQRTEGAVSVSRDGSGRYVATQTVTLANDFGGASQATVALDTGAGGITTRAWSLGGYKTVVVLQAHADSESRARSELERMTLRHTDQLSGDRLTLTTAVITPTQWPKDVWYSGLITANLPPEPAYTFDLDTGSGGISSSGLGGASIQADSGSGGVHIDGAFARMVADTGSGGVELLGTANTVSADTGSGGVVARLGATASGTWSFDTGSGDVSVTVRRAGGVACDVVADNGSGDIDVDLAGGQAVGDQDDDHQHVRTNGYDSSDVRLRIVADTGSGDIAIRDA